MSDNPRAVLGGLSQLHLGIIALLRVAPRGWRSHVGFDVDADDDAPAEGRGSCVCTGFERLADLIMLMHSGLSIDNCIGDRGCGELECRSMPTLLVPRSDYLC